MIVGTFFNIADAWQFAVRSIMKTGIIANTEYGVKACMINGMMLEIASPKEGWHARDPFCSPARIEKYKEQFKRGYKHNFDYTYMDRLTCYPINIKSGYAFDQLDWMQRQLRTRRDSKRLQAITWVPTMDTDTESPPCLQRIWVYPYANGECDVHIHYRSWDIYKGFEANLNALLSMINEELIFPNELTIKSLRCFGDNVHIYGNDFDAAKKL